MTTEHVVVDASALTDLLLGDRLGRAVAARLHGSAMHGPAHLDSEVLSALGRLHRAGRLRAQVVAAQLQQLAAAPLVRHPVSDLLHGAWTRRSRLRLADALYVELAERLGARLVTTDQALGRAVAAADVVAA